MIAVACLVCVAIGLIAGYAIGSSGPCPDCEAIETVPEAFDELPCGHGTTCIVPGNHSAGECNLG